MSIFKLEKPDLSGIKLSDVFNKITLFDTPDPSEDLDKIVAKTSYPKYLYWDEIKYRPWPKGLSAEEVWDIIKFLRKNPLNRFKSVVRSEEGVYFSWQSIPFFDQFLHNIDITFGDGPSPIPDADKDIRKRLELQQLREEAIASSQLEGAITTRKAGKQLILEQKKPLNNSDQMVLNSYNSMLRLKSDFIDAKLDKNLLFEMHRSITENTIAKDEVGRYRTNSDKIEVSNPIDGKIYHIPPNEKFLDQEIKRLFDYANDVLNDSAFVHPVIKAICLHFWIGYLHPFTDGNGRLARILFNWYLLRHDYWIFPYHALSKAIKDSVAQYRDAYIYSEQDDYDLTYFIDYIIRKIVQAQDTLKNDIASDKEDTLYISANIASGYSLNDRQVRLLMYYRNNKHGSATFTTHKNTYQISRITAIKDLRGLEELGFLTSRKIGREVHFYATEKISELH